MPLSEQSYEQLTELSEHRHDYDKYVISMLPEWLNSCRNINSDSDVVARLEQGPGVVCNPADLTWRGERSGQDQDPVSLLQFSNNFSSRFARHYSRYDPKSPMRPLDQDIFVPYGFKEGELTEGDSFWQGDSFEAWSKNHAAVARAKIVVPEVIMDARIAMTEVESERNGFEPREARILLFAAYHCIASLVDEGDNYVLRDGVVDDWILCR